MKLIPLALLVVTIGACSSSESVRESASTQSIKWEGGFLGHFEPFTSNFLRGDYRCKAGRDEFGLGIAKPDPNSCTLPPLAHVTKYKADYAEFLKHKQVTMISGQHEALAAGKSWLEKIGTAEEPKRGGTRLEELYHATADKLRKGETHRNYLLAREWFTEDSPYIAFLNDVESLIGNSDPNSQKAKEDYLALLQEFMRNENDSREAFADLYRGFKNGLTDDDADFTTDAYTPDFAASDLLAEKIRISGCDSLNTLQESRIYPTIGLRPRATFNMRRSLEQIRKLLKGRNNSPLLIVCEQTRIANKSPRYDPNRHIMTVFIRQEKKRVGGNSFWNSGRVNEWRPQATGEIESLLRNAL